MSDTKKKFSPLDIKSELNLDISTNGKKKKNKKTKKYNYRNQPDDQIMNYATGE
jgi:hypothetical protein